MIGFVINALDIEMIPKPDRRTQNDNTVNVVLQHVNVSYTFNLREISHFGAVCCVYYVSNYYRRCQETTLYEKHAVGGGMRTAAC